MKPLDFQQKAIEGLTRDFKRLWKAGVPDSDGAVRAREIVFKSPTGSGKTFMVSSFLNELACQPDWDQDVAFVWITFSDDLAMQSRDKFNDYFFPNLNLRLLTIEDFSQGKLNKNDILFLNWQKLVSRSAEKRVLRRPEEGIKKEQGFYFEDIVENTHSCGRQIIMVIDESHKNVTDAAVRDVIEPLNPRVILKVSATPEKEPLFSEVKNDKAAFVEVERDDVVAEGLIKGQIVCQTDEDLQKHKGQDLDTVLIDLAINKKKEIEAELGELALNPLIMIQLPNDDKAGADTGVKSKQLVVTDYLHKTGVSDDKIAFWFDNRKENLTGISDNDSPVDFLLFKQAAGTGWDCPRAQILVMYREINSAIFYTQTLGRILRIPFIDGKTCAKVPALRKSYLITNYKRNEVRVPEQNSKNKPLVFTAFNKKHTTFEIDPNLLTDYIPRADYGDLGNVIEFQRSFRDSLDLFFGIKGTDSMQAKRAKICAKGINLESSLTNLMIVDAVFDNFDDIITEVQRKGRNTSFEVSRNDVEKIFTSLCPQLLKEQTEEDAKVGNIARSWSPLKSALRIWMINSIDRDSDSCYRVFIKDIQKEAASVFRRAVTQALKDYSPQLENQRTQRKEAFAEKDSEVFKILSEYAYTDDYERVESKRCILEDAYFLKDYQGKDNEMSFLKYIDTKDDVDWWFKNGDYGKDCYAVKYFDTTSQKTKLFYPDWMIRFKDGTIGIFDTKGGITATSSETKDKAESLYKKINYLNGFNHNSLRYRGGIVVKENGVWMLNDSQSYHFTPGKLQGWKPFEEI